MAAGRRLLGRNRPRFGTTASTASLPAEVPSVLSTLPQPERLSQRQAEGNRSAEAGSEPAGGRATDEDSGTEREGRTARGSNAVKRHEKASRTAAPSAAEVSVVGERRRDKESQNREERHADRGIASSSNSNSNSSAAGGAETRPAAPARDTTLQAEGAAQSPVHDRPLPLLGAELKPTAPIGCQGAATRRPTAPPAVPEAEVSRGAATPEANAASANDEGATRGPSGPLSHPEHNLKPATASHTRPFAARRHGAVAVEKAAAPLVSSADMASSSLVANESLAAAEQKAMQPDTTALKTPVPAVEAVKMARLSPATAAGAGTLPAQETSTQAQRQARSTVVGRGRPRFSAALSVLAATTTTTATAKANNVGSSDMVASDFGSSGMVQGIAAVTLRTAPVVSPRTAEVLVHAPVSVVSPTPTRPPAQASSSGVRGGTAQPAAAAQPLQQMETTEHTAAAAQDLVQRVVQPPVPDDQPLWQAERTKETAATEVTGADQPQPSASARHSSPTSVLGSGSGPGSGPVSVSGSGSDADSGLPPPIAASPAGREPLPAHTAGAAPRARAIGRGRPRLGHTLAAPAAPRDVSLPAAKRARTMPSANAQAEPVSVSSALATERVSVSSALATEHMSVSSALPISSIGKVNTAANATATASLPAPAGPRRSQTTHEERTASREAAAAVRRRAATPCRYYKQGRCGKGAACPFSHAVDVERRFDICKHFLAGKCARGDACQYSHDPKRFPCRFHFSTGCQRGAACRYSHDVLTPEQRAWLEADFAAAGITAALPSVSVADAPLPPEVFSLFSSDADAPEAQEVELGDISARPVAEFVPRGSARSKAWAAASVLAPLAETAAEGREQHQHDSEEDETE